MTGQIGDRMMLSMAAEEYLKELGIKIEILNNELIQVSWDRLRVISKETSCSYVYSKTDSTYYTRKAKDIQNLTGVPIKDAIHEVMYPTSFIQRLVWEVINKTLRKENAKEKKK